MKKQKDNLEGTKKLPKIKVLLSPELLVILEEVFTDLNSWHPDDVDIQKHLRIVRAFNEKHRISVTLNKEELTSITANQ